MAKDMVDGVQGPLADAGGSSSYGVKGAGGGGKGGGRTPVVADNTMQSAHIVRILEAICEGPVKSISAPFLNETPTFDDEGEPNFDGFTYHTRLGLPDQPSIPNHTAQEAETVVDGKVTKTTPVLRTITDTLTDAVRIQVKLPALWRMNHKNGDMLATDLSYGVQYRPSGQGQFIDVPGSPFNLINQKNTSPVFLAHRFNLTGPGPWDIRVVRHTADADSAEAVQEDGYSYSNETWLYSYTQIINQKLTYPNTALLAVEARSEQFGSSIPSRAVLVEGLICDVPSNYNPVTRVYTGIWNGTFKQAWTDDPAWCLRALMTNKRWGLGSYIPSEYLTDTTLYSISQYCSARVSDGKGGTEPRFSFNAYIATREEAFQLMNAMASAFRGMIYYSLGSVMFAQDAPTDPEITVTRANTVNGNFAIRGASLKTVHNRVNVTYNNPEKFYKQDVASAEIPEDIHKNGLRPTDIIAFGCTSKSQALRAARWLLYTERMESSVLSYVAGPDHFGIMPGAIVRVLDPAQMGKSMGGRLKRVLSNTRVELDREVTLDAGEAYELVVHDRERILHYRSVASPAGTTSFIDISGTLPELTDNPVETVFGVRKVSGPDTLWRVLANREVGQDQYEITAVQHEPSKFQIVENNLEIPSFPPPLLPTGALPYPTGLNADEYVSPAPGAADASHVLVAFTRHTDPRIRGYELVYRVRGQEWKTIDLRQATSTKLETLTTGAVYHFKVCSYDGAGRRSAYSPVVTLRISGRPIAYAIPGVQNVIVTPGIRNITMKWDNPQLANFKAVEIYGGATDQVTNATKLASTSSERHVIGGLNPAQTLFLWTRVVTHGTTEAVSDFQAHGAYTTERVKQDDIAPGAIGVGAIDQDLAEYIQNNGGSAAGDAQAAREARDAAIVAKNLSESAMGNAQIARDQAQAAFDAADVARGQALNARDAAQGAAGQAEQAKTDAQAAYSLANNAAGVADTAKGLAQSARDAALASQNAAASSSGVAVSAKDASIQAVLATNVQVPTLPAEAWTHQNAAAVVGPAAPAANFLTDAQNGPYFVMSGSVTSFGQAAGFAYDPTRIYDVDVSVRAVGSTARTRWGFRTLSGTTSYYSGQGALGDLTVTTAPATLKYRIGATGTPTEGRALITPNVAGGNRGYFSYRRASGGDVQVFGIKITDVTEVVQAAASASAASTSAQNAGVSATNAGQSANAASIDRTAAQTARGEAVAAQTAAATSQTNAKTSENNAAQSATNAATSRNQAGDFATAASGSASTANTKATEASQSASAAETARTEAQTARGQAQTFAGQASTSASNAAGSASSAAISEGVAASAASAAYTTVLPMLPNDFASGMTYWTDWTTGNPTAVGNHPGAAGMYIGDANGPYLVMPASLTTWTNVMQKGVMRVVPGKTYRLTMNSRVSAISSNRYRLRIIRMNSSYEQIDEVFSTIVHTATTTWQDHTLDYVSPSNDTTAFLRFGMTVIGEGSAGGAIGIRALGGADVTAQVSSEQAATAAAQSATTAAASETAAGQSASAANTAKLDAQTARGQAQSAQTAAATSATNAKTSENNASTSATNAAGSANTAGQKADAATNSANSASTSAGNAAQSATAAQTSSVEARITASNGPILPHDFKAGLAYWQEQRGGAPGAGTTPLHSLQTNDPVFGNCASAQWTSAGQNILTQGVLVPQAGRIYRVTATFRVTIMDSGLTKQYNIVGIGLDANHADASDAANVFPSKRADISSAHWLTVHKLVTTFSSEAGDGVDQVWDTLATAPYVRFGFRSNNNVTASHRLGSLLIEDATEEIRASRSAAGALSSASAASGSANTATTKANEAGESATAAAASATEAETKRGQAETFASQASVSASNAAGSANSASISQGAAATAYTDTVNTTMLTLPPTMEGDGKWFTNWRSGTPNNAPSLIMVSGQTVMSNDDVEGPYLRVTSALAAEYHVMNRGVVPAIPGRSYRVTVRSRIAGSTVNGRIKFMRADMNGSYGWIRVASSPIQHASVGVAQNHTFEYTVPANTDAAFIRWGVTVDPAATPARDVGIFSIKTEDITAELAARNSASAAFISEGNAFASQDAAGKSASAADRSRIDAQTAEGNASASEGRAAISESNAAGSATSASGYSTLAAEANNSAVLNAAANLPSTMESDGLYFTTSTTGSPATVKPLSEISDLSFTTSATEGRYVRIPASKSTNTHILHKAVVPHLTGRVYRVTARVFAFSAIPANAIRFHGEFLTGTYTRDSSTSSEVAALAGNTWHTIVWEVTLGNRPNTAYVRLGLYRNAAATAMTGDMLVSTIKTEDISESKLAEGSAAASVKSAGEAKASADGAKFQADAASGHVTDANTARSQAVIAAGNAATAANDAATASSNARDYRDIAARLSSGMVSNNPVFNTWPGGWPAGYGGTVGEGTVTKETGTVAKYINAVRMNTANPATTQRPTLQLNSSNMNGPSNPARVRVVLELERISGPFLDTRLLLRWVGSPNRDQWLNIADELGSWPTAGVVYSLEWIIERPAGSGSVTDFVMYLDSTKAGGSSVNYRVHRFDFQEITASATASQFMQAKASIEGIQSSIIGFRVGAGGVSAGLELVALSNPNGTEWTAAKIQADKILLDGSVRARHLAVGSGANMLYNSDYTQDLMHYRYSGGGHAYQNARMALRPASTSGNYAGSTYPTLMLNYTGNQISGYADIHFNPQDKDGAYNGGYPIGPGDWVEWSAQLSLHRAAGAVLRMSFFNSNGTLITSSTVADLPAHAPSSSTNPDAWPRYGGTAVAPSGAAFVVPFVRLTGKGADGADSAFIFVHKPLLAPSKQDAELSAWSNGGQTVIDGSTIRTGSIVADDIQGGKMNARFLEVTELLNLQAQAALAYGKASISDPVDGIFFGRSKQSNKTVFGFSVSRTSANGQQLVELSENQFRIKNARHYVTSAQTPVVTTYTANRSKIAIPAAAKKVTVRGVGGGCGGVYGFGNQYNAGSNTIIRLYDGNTLRVTITCAGGQPKRLDRTSTLGHSNTFGDGSYYGSSVNWGQNATGPGGGGGGARRSGSGMAFYGGGAGTFESSEEVDVSGWASPMIEVVIGTGGAGGSGPDTNGSDSSGSGMRGQAEMIYTGDVDVPADVVPLVPTASGSFSKVSGGTTVRSFPNLGAGFWVIDTGSAFAPLNMDAITISPGQTIYCGGDQTAAFFSSMTPTYVPGNNARTIFYKFYSMGGWG